MRGDVMLSDFIAVMNVVVSGAIFILFVSYRSRLFEQNIVERVGLNVMAISAFIIAIKTMNNLVAGEIKFDYYGLLFRAGYLAYFASNIYTAHKVGVAVAVKKPKSHVFVSQPANSNTIAHA